MAVFEYKFSCPLTSGVHARPASCIEERAGRFTARIRILNERSGGAGDAKSVLSLVAADLRFQDPCVLEVEGEDGEAAFRAMKRFLEEDFAQCDEPLPAIEAPAGALRLPPCLRAASMEYLEGVAVSPGVGRGRAVLLEGLALRGELGRGRAEDPSSEKRRTEEGLRALQRRLGERLAAARSRTEAGVLKAQLSVARDPELARKIESSLESKNHSAAEAIAEAAEHFSNLLIATGSAVLADRVLDIQDVCAQLLSSLYGEAALLQEKVLEGPSVCIARSLTPGRFLSLDREHLKGLVIEQGGATSHTVILARSFGIPALIQARDAARRIASGQDVVVDGNLGLLVFSASEPALRYYEREDAKLARRGARLAASAPLPAETRDGRRIEVGANAAVPADVKEAVKRGADGIGLFRTEMLFMDREDAPSEEEQFEHFRGAAVSAAGRPVILRTLDAGGDKPVPCLRLPGEANPFLGCRAVRLYPEHAALFDAQLRAMLRAAAYGPVKVMVPMVSSVEEMRWVRARVEALCAADPSLPKAAELGMMLEVPSAAFVLDKLCAVADFFSIGSNDLAQYFLAADRENPKVADLYGRLHPSFLRFLRMIVEEIHARGRWVGLCGEMAGSPRYLPLWIGLGLDEISLSPASIAEVKAAVREKDAAACERLVGELMDLESASEAEAALDRFLQRPKNLPLLHESLVLSGSKSLTKEEAVKELVDNLYVTGRTNDPAAVEEAVWQREAVYATGLGHGFAIPHCKSDRVLANSLSILTLDQPIAWGSVDDAPVDRVILLVIRPSEDSEAHMRIFSRLARSLMHESFRQSLRNAESPEAIRDYLKETLECS